MLQPALYRHVAKFRSLAAREHVSLNDTPAVRWYALGSPAAPEGFCALLQVKPGTVRIKGVYVFKEWRGLGKGAVMTDALIALAKAEGATSIEVIALNPVFYLARGFVLVAMVRPGVARLLWSAAGITAKADQ